MQGVQAASLEERQVPAVQTSQRPAAARWWPGKHSHSAPEVVPFRRVELPCGHMVQAPTPSASLCEPAGQPYVSPAWKPSCAWSSLLRAARVALAELQHPVEGGRSCVLSWM